MPTSADLLLDTSVAVALVDQDSPYHEAAFERTTGLSLGLAGHAVFETFSVLTRMPGASRRDAMTVQRIIRANFPASHFLSASESKQALTSLATSGVDGGSVYDGLIGLAAASAGIVLLSRDRRAARTYTDLGVAFELL